MPRQLSAINRTLAFEDHFPYIVSVGYAVIISAVIALLFDPPPPRFMDLYLIGMALTHARWSRGPALALYVASLFCAAWILPPTGSFAIGEGHEIYRIFSYSLTAAAIVIAIDYAKGRLS